MQPDGTNAVMARSAPTCVECGFSYVRGLPEDERLHRRYHDEIARGIPLRASKHDQILARVGDVDTILVDHRSSRSQRQLAQRIGSAANRETRFDFGVYHAEEGGAEYCDLDSHAFLLRHANRGIGFLVLRWRSPTWWYDWHTWPKNADANLPARRTVGFVWVHRAHRRRGLAASLVREAARYLGVAVSDLAWEVPMSPSGEALARSLCPSGCWVH